MDSSDAIQFAVLFILIGLSAFFSSAETSLTTVNKLRIKTLHDEGNRRAGKLLKVVENPGKLLSTILIGNNIVNISASSLATSLAIHLLGNAGVGIATGVITLLVLIFGEITPKTMAALYAEKLSLSYAPVIYILMILLTPVIFIVNKLSYAILLLLRVDPNGKTQPMTENELRTIVDVSHEDGVIETEERQMIYNVFDFGDSEAKDIMVPRIDMTFVHVDTSYEDLIQLFKEETYTRYPVYEETTDSILGTINVKDLIGLDNTEHFSIRSILREPYFTYEHKSTSSLLLEMREQSINFAIVLDEYGATAGLITLEDLLEEIVGEIRDEYDEGEEEMLTAIIPDQEYLVLGSAKLEDLDEALGLDLESEEYDSIGGYIIEQLDRIPEPGESLQLENGIRLVVDQLQKNRIELVHLYLPEKDSTAEHQM
ncbi:hemolysin family protein [Ruminococcus sp. OA3]|uniref:HlyC/CorC family transporter n=1 Tax=Ruminococcus sp. OA3 TaxID=2914164 RepID=UPI001F055CC3|nr:hemolysin family protein [Ruminococcus sp. OA3]MCH1982973.1 hemolysin family protein [Ruminococcus sp. OA3]